MAKTGNRLAICAHCGQRYFSEVAEKQLDTHMKTCEPYQSEVAEQAKLKDKTK